MITLLADGDALARHLLLDAVLTGAVVCTALAAVIVGAVLIVRHLGR